MTTYTWYQTSHSYQWERDDGQTVRAPSREIHAKRFGTSLTACGLRCDTWPKFWHLQYQGGWSGSCERCDGVVTNESDALASAANS